MYESSGNINTNGYSRLRDQGYGDFNYRILFRVIIVLLFAISVRDVRRDYQVLDGEACNESFYKKLINVIILFLINMIEGALYLNNFRYPDRDRTTDEYVSLYNNYRFQIDTKKRNDPIIQVSHQGALLLQNIIQSYGKPNDKDSVSSQDILLSEAKDSKKDIVRAVDNESMLTRQGEIPFSFYKDDSSNYQLNYSGSYKDIIDLKSASRQIEWIMDNFKSRIGNEDSKDTLESISNVLGDIRMDLRLLREKKRLRIDKDESYHNWNSKMVGSVESNLNFRIVDKNSRIHKLSDILVPSHYIDLLSALIGLYDRVIKREMLEEDAFVYHYNEVGMLINGWGPREPREMRAGKIGRIKVYNQKLSNQGGKSLLTLDPNDSHEEMSTKHYHLDYKGRVGDLRLLEIQVNGLMGMLNLVPLTSSNMGKKNFQLFLSMIRSFPKDLERYIDANAKLFESIDDIPPNDGKIQIDNKDDTGLYSQRLGKAGSNKVVDDEESKESVTDIEAMVKEPEDKKVSSTYLRDHPLDGKMDVYKYYRLVFLNHGHEMNKMFVHAEQIILLDRLLNVLNGTVTGKPLDIQDLYYHWDDDGLLRIGRHPLNDRGFNDEKLSFIKKVKDSLSFHGIIEPCLSLRFEDSKYFSFNYRVGNLSDSRLTDPQYKDVIDRNVSILKTQLNLLYTVMGYVFYKDEPSELSEFERLRMMIGKTFLKGIEDWYKDRLSEYTEKIRSEKRIKDRFLKSHPIDDTMDTDRDYPLRFEINGPVSVLDLGLTLRLPSQQIVLLGRLIDQCNDIVTDKSRKDEGFSNSQYHWNDDGLILTGKHPTESRQDISRKNDSVYRIITRLVTNTDQKLILHLHRGWEEGTGSPFYGLFCDIGKVSQRNALADLELLKVQLEFIVAIMKGMVSTRENPEFTKFRMLRIVIGKDLAKGIFGLVKDNTIWNLRNTYPEGSLKSHPIDDIGMGLRMDTNRHYSLNFKVSKDNHRSVIVSDLPAQQVILIGRLIGKCNDIIAKRSLRMEDCLHHWNDQGLLIIGKHPGESERDHAERMSIVKRITERITINTKQKRLLGLDGYFDHKINRGSYRIVYEGDIGIPSDTKLLRDQLEWISTMMRHVTHNLPMNEGELSTFHMLRYAMIRLPIEMKRIVTDEDNGISGFDTDLHEEESSRISRKVFNRYLGREFDVSGNHALRFLNDGQELHRLTIRAQQMILFGRLVDRCNSIITNKPGSIDDLTYHWNDDGLISIGEYPGEDWETYKVRFSNLLKVTSELIGNKGRITLDFNGTDLNCMTQVSSDVPMDLGSLRVQLNWISTIMRSMGYGKKHVEPKGFERLRVMVGETLPDSIDKIRQIEEERKTAEEERLRKIEKQRIAAEVERKKRLEKARLRELQKKFILKYNPYVRPQILKGNKSQKKSIDIQSSFFKPDWVKDIDASYPLRFLNDDQEMYRISVPYQQVVLLQRILEDGRDLFGLIRINEDFNDVKRQIKKYFSEEDREKFYEYHRFAYFGNDDGEISRGFHEKEDRKLRFETLMAYFDTEDFKNFRRYMIQQRFINHSLSKERKELSSRFCLIDFHYDFELFTFNVNTDASRYVMRVGSDEEIYKVMNMLRLTRSIFSFGSRVMGQMYYTERPAELDGFNTLRTMLDTTFPDRLETGFKSRMFKKVGVVYKEVGDGERVRLLESVPMTDQEINDSRKNGKLLIKREEFNSKDKNQKVLMYKKKVKGEGINKIMNDKSVLKNNLSHGMEKDRNYNLIFLVRLFSQGTDIGKIYDLDLKISLPAEQIEFVRRIFVDMYESFIFNAKYNVDNFKNFSLVFWTGSYLGYLNDRTTILSKNWKININNYSKQDVKLYYSEKNKQIRFAEEFLLKGQEDKDFHYKPILNHEIFESSKKLCFKFYIDIDTSSRKSYLNDMTIFENHIDGFSLVVRSHFVKIPNDKHRPSWFKYIDPLYRILNFKIQLKIKDLFNSRDFWASHRESLKIIDCSQFESLPYNDMDRNKVKSLKEESEWKNDDQPVAQHAKKKMRGVDQVDQTSFDKSFCSGIEAERVVLIDVSFEQRIDPTHCIMQYQHALLLKVLLDYSADYLQGKSREDFTYGGYNDRFCLNMNYDPVKRKELNNLNERYLKQYAREIDTGRVKHKSYKYPFLIRLLGEPNLPEVGDRRLHYPVERHNGLRVTLEEFKYLEAQTHWAIEVVKTISLHRYVRIERDTKRLLCLLNDIPYSVGSLIGSTFKKSIEAGMLQRIDFDNVLNLYNGEFILNTMDRKCELHYHILMQRVDIVDIINRLIFKNFSSSLVFKEIEISEIEKDPVSGLFKRKKEYGKLIQNCFSQEFNLSELRLSMKTIRKESMKKKLLIPKFRGKLPFKYFIQFIGQGGDTYQIGSLKKKKQILYSGTMLNKKQIMPYRQNIHRQNIFSLIDTLARRYRSLHSKYQECYKDFKNNWVVNNNKGEIEFSEFIQIMDLTKNDLLDIDHYRKLIDKIELPTNDPVEINAMRRFELMAFQLEEDISILSHYEHQIADIMLD